MFVALRAAVKSLQMTLSWANCLANYQYYEHVRLMAGTRAQIYQQLAAAPTLRH